MWRCNLEFGSAYYADLRALRLVSKRWRDIIDNDSTFWTFVSCRGTEEDWEMAMEKSRGRPLDVSFSCRSSRPACMVNHMDFLQVAPIYDLPLRSLTLKLSRSFGRASFRDLLARPAPLLEAYRVFGDRATLQIDGELFAGEAPRLRSVDFLGCSVPWNSASLSGLRSLTLNYVPLDGAFEHDRLHHIISASPTLEILCIANCSISGNNLAPDPVERTTLPSLHSLTLSDITHQAATWILNAISAPRLELLRLAEDSRVDASVWMERDAAKRWIEEYTARNSLHHLSLDIQDRHSRLDLQYGGLGITLHCTASSLSARVLSLLESTPKATLSLITSFCLDIEGSLDMHIPAIRPFFTSINTLQLHFNIVRMEANIAVLSNPLPASGWLFPQMSRLEIGWESYDAAPDLIMLVNNRRQAARVEEQGPVVLETLILERGEIRQQVVEDIRELGVAVDVLKDVVIT